MHRDTFIGLIAVVGIWLTAGYALPQVKFLDQFFSAPQLMVFRGFATAALAFLVLRGNIGRVDRYTYAIGLVLPLATLGLFEGIQRWGAGPTIIIVTATPVINVLFQIWRGRAVSIISLCGLACIFLGVAMARWEGTFDWVGLGWSLFATLMNGILYELFARSTAGALERCFSGSAGMGILGLILSVGSDWSGAAEPELIWRLALFVIFGGLLYWIANLIAFDKLETAEASILAQGETPAVIWGAYLFLGERMTLIQGIGVGVAFLGAAMLSLWIAKKSSLSERDEQKMGVS